MVAEKMTAAPPEAVLGVILAGGASRRYGSDKALAKLDGRTLLDHIIGRVRPQVTELVISGPAREGCSTPAIADEHPGQGPLAGLHAVLRWADARQLPLVATFACDTPFIPIHCVERFHAAIGTSLCAVACRAGELQPTCALWRTAALASVGAALASGERSLRGAIDAVDAVSVEFDARAGAKGDPFFNINRLQEMKSARSWLEHERVSA